MLTISNELDTIYAADSIKDVMNFLHIVYWAEENEFGEVYKLTFLFRRKLYTSSFYSHDECMDIQNDFTSVKARAFPTMVEIINDINSHLPFARLKYERDMDDDGYTEYNVLVQCGVRFVGDVEKDAEMLCRMLDDCIEAEREFLDGSNRHRLDVDPNHVAIMSDLHHRINEIQSRRQWTTNPKDTQQGCYETLKLGRLIELINGKALASKDVTLKIVTDTVETMTSKRKIQALNVESVLCKKVKRGTKEWKPATLILNYNEDVLTMTFIPRELEYGIQNVSLNYNDSLLNKMGVNKAMPGSMLLGFNAEDKIVSVEMQCYGMTAELDNPFRNCLSTEELNDTLSFAFYWGKEYFAKKRYAEALIYMEQSFRLLTEHFDSIEKQKRSYYKLALAIYHCYGELGLYDRAFYYCDLVYRTNKWLGAKEYIDCLLHLHDFRALRKMKCMLKDSLECEEDGVDDPMELMDMELFREYIFRTYITYMIERRKYSEAKRMLRLMEKHCSKAKAFLESTRHQIADLTATDNIEK